MIGHPLVPLSHLCYTRYRYRPYRLASGNDGMYAKHVGLHDLPERSVGSTKVDQTSRGGKHGGWYEDLSLPGS